MRAKVFMITVLVAGLTGFVVAQQPDRNDPYATNLLGVTVGEPITNGFLFLSGQYIDAPYVFEQRGMAVFVNGTYVTAIDSRNVYPEIPCTNDPGIPASMTINTRVADAIDMAGGKFAYLKYKYGGKELEDRFVDYLRSLPCVARVERVAREDSLVCGGQHGYRLYDHAGRTAVVMIPANHVAPTSPPVAPPREKAVKRVLGEKSNLEGWLNKNYVVFTGPKSSERYVPFSSSYWDAIVGVLRSNAPVKEKFAKLKALDFLSASDTFKNALACDGNLFTNFQASAQLEQRIHNLKGSPAESTPEAWTPEHISNVLTTVSENLAVGKDPDSLGRDVWIRK